MPKIVDHEAHKEDLARRAAEVFSEFGFNGIGMRAMAEKLGLSKSALYHYFPTKEALFLASTEQVMTGVAESKPQTAFTVEAQLAQLFDRMRKDFGSEMALVFDYLRGKSRGEIANDPAMQKAVETYQMQVIDIVGTRQAPDVLCKMLGALLIDYFSGGTWPGLDEQKFLNP